MANTPANNQAALQKALAAQQQANLTFMKYSFVQPDYVPSNGSNSLGAGNTLYWDVPIIAGGWLTKLELVYNLNLTVASGTTATLNAGAPYNVLSNVVVTYGNEQVRVHPYAQHVFNQMGSYARAQANETVQYANADVDGQVYSMPPSTLPVGTNSYKFSLDVPMNDIYPEPTALSVVGLLPMSSTGTRIQVSATCAPNFTGADPLNAPFSVSGGSVSVSGSVDLIVWYRSNESLTHTASMAANIFTPVMPTAQTIKINEINPLTAGSKVAQYIRNPYAFVRMVNIVIDGNQSDKFSAASNMQAYEIDQAQNSNSAFFRYDSTTGGFVNYYKRVRQQFGRDFDSGVVVFDATTMNQRDSALGEGEEFLNLTNSGYPAAQQQYQVGSTGSVSGITPRVVTYARILNSAGIQLG
ncbi:hypothetical protein LLE49_19995 [Alicyclobacillus tolerans]|uniref:hypothetical protein n=1 Tax=Alicyclobacillus tolerans TaxID=90970 RepID=UPI001F3F4BDF|nr:hypothetical protein [Alicyclobacillus tolerans]MCF8567006.1 hypothetical protein [Alicyclobacillus tolerans]